MTVIAAYEDKDSYWIASDSLTSRGDLTEDHGSKLFKGKNYYLGVSGSPRIENLLTESNKIPKKIQSKNDLYKLRDEIHDLLITKSGAPKSTNDDDIITHPIHIVIICKFGIYNLTGQYALQKIRPYGVEGSGYQIAIGSLYNSKQNKHDGKTAVTLAVKAAITHHAHCGGKVYTANIKKEK